MADEAAVSTPTPVAASEPASVSTPATFDFRSDNAPNIGDIDISEAALRGEEAPVAPVTPTPAPAVEVKPADLANPPTTTEAPTAPSEPTGTEGEATPTEHQATAPDKPPKGFVPTAAVQEARRENAALKAQIQALMQAQATPPPPAADTSAWADFKELSQPELAALVTDDPGSALMYTTQLVAYKEHQREVATQAIQANAVKSIEDSMVGSAYTRMEAAIPGLFGGEGTAGSELAAFAAEIGFGPELFHLTDPNVRIVLPGESKPTLLGEGAAAIVEMLANLRGKLRTTATAETALRERLTTELTEKIQADLLTKFKTQAPGFQSLASIPGTQADSGSASLAGKVLSSDEFSRLSSQDQERYLAGA